ncbi:cupin domain-containing protein [Sulfuricurvum sp. PD_MW2]|uniref:cupin domain-containing protein n=1 Tax=Sulfuricurvum sp. PD_MW2 TaxID=2027917 RepID=UPI0025EEDEB6|nr:cupin domain-containing protein [Sulfuricurvum sp. PD_MW2]
MIHVSNLHQTPSPDQNSEHFTTILDNGSLRIEAIRSWLKTPGELYNQEQDEWVVLIEGEAKLEVENQILNLQRGDYLFIPKHTPHRVHSTSKDALWIGIFSS